MGTARLTVAGLSFLQLAVGVRSPRDGSPKSELLGPELGALGGALAVGCVGNLGARLLRRPAIIGILPGLLLLVPGSLGMRAMSSLLREDTVAGIETAVSIGVVGMAMVTGLLSANILVSPRRSL